MGKRSHTFGWVRKGPHAGWDLYAAQGTPVYAIANGTVQTVPEDPRGYGTSLQLKFEWCPGKTLWAFYAHLSKVIIARGPVREGQMIGLTGISGNAASNRTSDGLNDHLHFEIRTKEWPPKASSVPKGSPIPGRIDPGHVLGFAALANVGDGTMATQQPEACSAG
jgi:murein DD-endopeptidase MepM/ murein hydrolase activator NlpD